jgi:hypothetical protein
MWSFVCLSVMEVDREVRLSLTDVIRDTGGEEFSCKCGRADRLTQ